MIGELNSYSKEQLQDLYSSCTRVATLHDREAVEDSIDSIMKEKEILLQKRLEDATMKSNSQLHYRIPTSCIPSPFATELNKEIEYAQELYMKFHPNFPTWNELKFYQKLAIALIYKYKLNNQQTLAFLLLANNVGQQLFIDKPLQPLRMLVTGPGGTGKSHIFAAFTTSYTCSTCRVE